MSLDPTHTFQSDWGESRQYVVKALIVERIRKGMQRANFQKMFFLVQLFLHCVHNSIVLVEQDLIFFIFAMKLKIIIFNLFTRFKIYFISF